MMASGEDTATDTHNAPALSGWRAIVRDLAQMVRFYSRLPVPKLPFEADAHAIPDFRTAPRMLPFAGLIIGLPAALMLWLLATLGLPPFMAAGLAVAVAVLVSGAFHEDGLADTFDGLGGGTTPDRRLEIMKDSRIGSFGGAALILGIGLRVAALASLIETDSAFTAAVLMWLAAALSRSLGLVALTVMPPARPGGFSSAVGRPTPLTLSLALVICCILAVGAAAQTGISLVAMLMALGVVLIPVGLMCWWSWRSIQGQTGDIAGAIQQLSEIAFYAGLLISSNDG
jgi:adenosylcobinamide-GDP ribazoletransferase